MIAGLAELVAARSAFVDGLAVSELLARDLPPGQTARCRILQVDDGSYAFNLARPDDLDLIPALTGHAGDPWAALARAMDDEGGKAIFDRALLFHMPAARFGEVDAGTPLGQESCPSRSAAGARVVDMSALWAGPLCAGLLARAGADVLRIDSVGRPDPTPRVSPDLDRRINSEKRRLALDLRMAADRERLLAILADADVLVTSARAAALARLGLTPEMLFIANPKLIWVAVTAYGFSGSGAERIGFGDDCAVAGGLVEWNGATPMLTGNAIADPLTGIEAARAVLAMLADARESVLQGEPALLDMSLSGVARGYAWLLAS